MKTFYKMGKLLHQWRQRRAFNLYSPAGNIIAARQYCSSSNHQGEHVTYLSDFRGSITSILDDEGNFIQGYRYTDYGITTRIGEGAFNEFAYTQGIWDELTGLYYLNARFYNPVDGRFLTQDPYRGSNDQPDTWHLYGYCIGNPINFIDPSGNRLVIPHRGHKNRLRGYLQSLTRYRVNVADDGRVTVSTTRNSRRPGSSLPSGNRLIRRVSRFGTNATVRIQFACGPNSDSNHSRYIRSDRRVFLRVTGAHERSIIRINGHGFNRPLPRRIILAHELIHADRHQRRVILDRSIMQENRFTVRRNGRVVKLIRSIPREEFQTIGLGNLARSGTRENTIRSEQGLHKRLCWTNPWTD